MYASSVSMHYGYEGQSDAYDRVTRSTAEPEIDIDREVWDTEYRNEVRELLRQADGRA